MIADLRSLPGPEPVEMLPVLPDITGLVVPLRLLSFTSVVRNRVLDFLQHTDVVLIIFWLFLADGSGIVFLWHDGLRDSVWFSGIMVNKRRL